MTSGASLFRLLGDEARLRLLRLLSLERLNVTELTSILGLAQSGVSRHLGLLKDAGLVTEQREGGYTYFRLSPVAGDAGSPLAGLLAAHPAVAAVHYPGLPSHPDHELALRQQRGAGGMLSFELRDHAAVPAFLAGLRCFTLAESLGGVESLIAHPATMTHASMTEEVRERAGITAGLLRLSVGIESVEDLAADLAAALHRVSRARAVAVAT